MSHCSCSRVRRQWLPSGTCARCRLTVHESSIMDAVKAILIADPQCLLWRNNVGVAQAEYGKRGRLARLIEWIRGPMTTPPPEPPDLRPLVYGLCPGSADLIGLYGERFLAVETKTPRGTQSPEQVTFERWVVARRGIYALVRSEQQATELLAWLQSGASELPRHLRGAGNP